MPRQDKADNEQLKFLAVALEEAHVRGIEIPEEISIGFKKQKLNWPIAENGYFVRNDGKIYNPSEKQGAFIASKSPFSQFYGKRGSGKSAAGAQKALFKIKQGLPGAVMNPDFENFKYSTWPELKEWIPWDLVVPSQRHRKNAYWEPTQPFTMVFMNGAVVYCKGLKNPDSARGPNINWLWYDEAGRDPTGDGWRVASASVRVGDNPQRWATMTPKNFEHWSYKFFIEQDIPDDVKRMFAEMGLGDKILIESFHATIDDNKENLDPLFLANLSTTYPSGWMREQEVNGEYANEGGKIGDSGWFRNHMLDTKIEKIEKAVRYWDFAATEKKSAKDDPDEAVGTKIEIFFPEKNTAFLEKYGEFVTKPKDKNFNVQNQVCGYWEWEKLLEAICNTARHDGPAVEILIEQEPASGGKNQIAAVKSEFKRHPELMAHKVTAVPSQKVGDRVLAANTYWFGTAAEGRMWMTIASWNQRTLAQIDGFTQVEHDDRVTSITGGMFVSNPFKNWKKVPFMAV